MLIQSKTNISKDVPMAGAPGASTGLLMWDTLVIPKLDLNIWVLNDPALRPLAVVK